MNLYEKSDKTGGCFCIGKFLPRVNGSRTSKNLSARIVSIVMVVFFAALLSSSASAAITCNPTNVSKVLAAGTIVIPMNPAPGTVVSTVAPAGFMMNCTFLNTTPYNTSAGVYIQLSVTAALAPGFADVYKTNIDGLGVRYILSAPTCNTSNAPLQNSAMRISCSLTGTLAGPSIVTNLTVTSVFVTYGAVKGGASSLSSIPMLSQTYETTDNVGKVWNQAAVYTGSATGALNAATCSVQTENVAVNLPTPALRAFAGVGSVAGRQAFHLDFVCATGAQVSIVITDAVAPTNRSNVLTPSADSTAKGIGIQVLKADGTPVLFGPDQVGISVENQWLIGASPSGVLVLPLSAQYIRTGALTPGSVKALATFTMSYN
jgi:type 1 fimbria pilin